MKGTQTKKERKKGKEKKGYRESQRERERKKQKKKKEKEVIGWLKVGVSCHFSSGGEIGRASCRERV